MKVGHPLDADTKIGAVVSKPHYDKVLSYIELMILNDHPEDILKKFTQEQFDSVTSYIDRQETATTFNEEHMPKAKSSNSIITSEVIYYWMVSLNIPYEFETWHLNRLITLIKVVNAKNAPQKKMSRREVFNQNRQLNQARRQQYNTRG